MEPHDTSPPEPLPPFRTRVLNFVQALASHLRNGLKTVEPEVIEQRLAICESCEHFTGNHCAICGCSCGGGQTFLNKLAWDSEHCPLDPPKW